MDCNSIIYDSVHLLEKNINEDNGEIPDDFEDIVIQNVIKKIDAYVDFIKPSETLYIAFDGVAPFAKMEQQRTRRYKSWFLSNNSFATKVKKISWNTSAITPGTIFMNKLSNEVRNYFLNKEEKLKIKQIIVSGSDEKGEGEHKMYHHIRKINTVNDFIAVYGLDADLIMLSIFHLKYSKNIFVFRETPDFFKNMIQVESAPNEPHFLDIRQLSISILCEMNCKYSHQHRINDYVFLCFFLGNDFLPHFPAMNIRTHGITALIDIYRNCIGNNKDRYFIDQSTNKIQWKNVAIFIKEISKIEHQLLLNEYNVRKKFDRFTFPEKTSEEKDNVLLNVPIINRAEEKYICPEEPYWEQRFYSTLFNKDYNSENIRDICKNYFEGLEWVYIYYNADCPNWRWKYNYHYAPLFTDLYKFIPKDNITLLSFNDTSVHPFVQLSYVLPHSNLHLLPSNIENNLKQNYSHLYPNNYTFKWAFCRYFWEAHPILPEISLTLLENI
jgi:5'-3' exonuclease